MFSRDASNILFSIGKVPDTKIPPKLLPLLISDSTYGNEGLLRSEEFLKWSKAISTGSTENPYRVMTKALIKKLVMVQFIKIVESPSKDEHGVLMALRTDLMSIWDDQSAQAEGVFKNLMMTDLHIEDNNSFHSVFQLWLDYAKKLHTNDVTDVLKNIIAECNKTTLVRLQAAVEQTSHKIPYEQSKLILKEITNKFNENFHLRQKSDKASKNFERLSPGTSVTALIESKEFIDWMASTKNLGVSSKDLIKMITDRYGLSKFTLALAQNSQLLGNHPAQEIANELQSSLLVSWRLDNVDASTVFDLLGLSMFIDDKSKDYQKYWMNAWFKYVQEIELEDKSPASIIYNTLTEKTLPDSKLIYWLSHIDKSSPIIAEVWKQLAKSWISQGKEADEVYAMLSLFIPNTLLRLLENPNYTPWKIFMEMKHPSDYDKQMYLFLEENKYISVSVKDLSMLLSLKWEKSIYTHVKGLLMGLEESMKDNADITDEIAFNKLILTDEKPDLIKSRLYDTWVSFMKLKHQDDSPQQIIEALKRIYEPESDLLELWKNVEKHVMEGEDRPEFLELHGLLFDHYVIKYKSTKDLLSDLELMDAMKLLRLKEDDNKFGMITSYINQKHSSDVQEKEKMKPDVALFKAAIETFPDYAIVYDLSTFIIKDEDELVIAWKQARIDIWEKELFKVWQMNGMNTKKAVYKRLEAETKNGVYEMKTSKDKLVYRNIANKYGKFIEKNPSSSQNMNT